MIIPVLIRTLVEEKSILITGFGTFYVKNVPSQIRENIIYPPQNIVVFEFAKDVEDFRFVSKLSQWEQIRIDEAQDKISAWVALIEEGLVHNKSVFFDDFGTFSKDLSGTIIFQGMIITQLNVENEGLKPVVLYPKNKEEDPQKPVKDKREVLVTKKKNRDRSWFITIICASIVVLVALFLKDHIRTVYKKIATKETVAETQLIVPPSDEIILDEILPDDILKEEPVKEDTLIQNETQENPPFSLSTYTELYLPYQKGNYYIIAGSFVKEESALLHIKQKKLDTISAKLIIHPENPRIRVCVGVFDNEEEAIKNATLLNKNYWVLK